MKGATTDPWVKTIKHPNKAKTINIGNSQYFFLSFKNSQNSFIKLIISIVYPLNLVLFFFEPSMYLFLKILNLKDLF